MSASASIAASGAASGGLAWNAPLNAGWSAPAWKSAKQRHPIGWLLVLGLHVLVVGVLLAQRHMPVRPAEPAPLMLMWLASPTTAKAAATPAKEAPRKAEVLPPLPQETKAVATPQPTQAPAAVPDTPAATRQAVAEPQTTAPAPVLAAPPRQVISVPASALRYLVMPQQVYPLASRRAGEQGVVRVKVLVDMQGLPREVRLHSSSGFARLDEQAVQAMRAARFQPCTDERSQPVECEAVAPLAYSLD